MTHPGYSTTTERSVRFKEDPRERTSKTTEKTPPFDKTQLQFQAITPCKKQRDVKAKKNEDRNKEKDGDSDLGREGEFDTLDTNLGLSVRQKKKNEVSPNISILTYIILGKLNPAGMCAYPSDFPHNGGLIDLSKKTKLPIKETRNTRTQGERRWYISMTKKWRLKSLKEQPTAFRIS